MKNIFAILFCLLCFANTGLSAKEDADLPKISVNAQATIYKPADELQMVMGVISLKETAAAALSENNTLMQSVIDAMIDVGLKKSEFQTGHFSIRPTYQPYPKDPPPNWKPSIDGYEVTNTIRIKTDKLLLAGKIIDAGNKAGANSIDNIQFGLKDDPSYWNEVLSQAVVNGINDAKILASAADVRLVRILSISMDKASAFPRHDNIHFAKMMAPEALPPLEAGNVPVTAYVSIIYEID